LVQSRYAVSLDLKALYKSIIIIIIIEPESITEVCLKRMMAYTSISALLCFAYCEDRLVKAVQVEL